MGFFLLFFSLGISPTVLAQSLSLEQAKAEVLKLELAKKPAWQSLLQLHADSSRVPDPRFYIGGSFHGAQEELLDFVDKLYSAEGQIFACRFPARYFWLQNQMAITPRDLQLCAELESFLKRAPLDTTSVVFASENISQPSSMMGHVFFKLAGTNQNGIPVSHMISFFTELQGVNFPKLVLESLVTGKKGLYTLSPYEPNKNYYLYNEQRSIWEYQLKLSDAERKLLGYYFFELKDISFTYLFHSFNCATLVRNILAVVHPELTEHPSLWVTPLDVVRAVDQDSIVEQRIIIPSTRWKIKAFQENIKLSPENKRKIETRQFADLEIAGLDLTPKVLTLELASSYNDYQLENDSIARTDWSSAHRLLGEQKKQLLQDTTIDLSNYKKPSATPPDSQAFIRARSYANKDSYLVGFLPASHALSDDGSQYQNESELKMGEISFDYTPESKVASLNSLILYSAISLQPVDSLTGGLSGALQFGIKPKLAEDLTYRRAGFVEGGLGKTYRLLRDVDVYGLGMLGYQTHSSSGLYLAPTVGLIVREVLGMKTLISVADELQIRKRDLLTLQILQVWNISDYAVSFGYSLNRINQVFANNEAFPGIANQYEGYELSFKSLF